MLVEKGISEAMIDFAEGKKVFALMSMADGSLVATSLEDVFPVDTRYLVECKTEGER